LWLSIHQFIAHVYSIDYSLWAKDIVFIVSDGYLDGMHETTCAQQTSTDLDAEPLALASGVIWTALNIDYPGHSFSHLGLFFGRGSPPSKARKINSRVFLEGLNGRLPNQDLMNSVQRIARSHNSAVPVTVYDHLQWHDPAASPSELSFLPSWLRHNPDAKDFAHRAKNIFRHIGYQARGKASGVHGLYHQYATTTSHPLFDLTINRFRIDAITVFAVPATGPHGFHALGR
jgi:glycosylphosphatidylinositol transamidase